MREVNTNSQLERTGFKCTAQRDTPKARIVQLVGVGKVAEIDVSADTYDRLLAGRSAEASIYGP